MVTTDILVRIIILPQNDRVFKREYYYHNEQPINLAGPHASQKKPVKMIGIARLFLIDEQSPFAYRLITSIET